MAAEEKGGLVKRQARRLEEGAVILLFFGAVLECDSAFTLPHSVNQTSVRLKSREKVLQEVCGHR